MNSPAETSSRCWTDFSLNWCIRLRSPWAVTEASSQPARCARGRRSGGRGCSVPGRARRRAASRPCRRGAAQLPRVVGDSDRVQVDDAVDRRRRGPGPRRTAHRADVVAEVLAPGRLETAEDPHGAGGYRAPRARGCGTVCGMDAIPGIGAVWWMERVLAAEREHGAAACHCWPRRRARTCASSVAAIRGCGRRSSCASRRPTCRWC